MNSRTPRSPPLRPLLPLLLCVLAMGGCAGTSPQDAAAPGQRAGARDADESGAADPLLARTAVPHVVVAERWVSAAVPRDETDSVAAWVAPDGALWVIATAKEADVLVAYDGASGRELRRVGATGSGPGQFRRPNGIAVIGDLVFVVERDNRRVQVLRLPAFEPLGSFGEQDLVSPYGLWARRLASGTPGEPERIEVIVSDSYVDPDPGRAGEVLPPPVARLGERFERFLLQPTAASLGARRVAGFGDTGAAGAVRIAESLWGDPHHDRLLVAEEDRATGTRLRDYLLGGGRYAGRDVGAAQFRAQAEGIALWACADGTGYWIGTDQFRDRTLFHVFDRVSLASLGAFAGRVTANTDGVWLQQGGTAAFPDGVFFAVHDDRGVAAFDWRDIARALGLRQRCSGA
jgi:3-phytase